MWTSCRGPRIIRRRVLGGQARDGKRGKGDDFPPTRGPQSEERSWAAGRGGGGAPPFSKEIKQDEAEIAVRRSRGNCGRCSQVITSVVHRKWIVGRGSEKKIRSGMKKRKRHETFQNKRIYYRRPALTLILKEGEKERSRERLLGM